MTRSVRFICVAGMATPVIALAVALWWQYHDGLQPCSLCWIQRAEAAIVLVGFGAFQRWRAGAGLALLGAVSGTVTALMQLAEVQGTAPGLFNVCAITTSGVPSCAVAGAHPFLGMRLVDWSLSAFVFWFLLALSAIYLSRNAKSERETMT